MISLQTFGSASAVPPLVVIPGIDGSIGSVQPIVEKLSRERRVILVDYTQETEPTLESLSGAITGILREQLNEPFDLLGQSIGTIIAAKLAVQALPVRRVVLISTFLRLNDFKLGFSNLLATLSPRWLYRLLSRPVLIWQCGPVGDGNDHLFLARSAESDPSIIVKRTGWEIGHDFHSDISGVRQPLLVLMGERDRFVPNARLEIDELRRVVARRDARVIAVPTAGHVLFPTLAINFAVLQIAEFLA
jgi:pimeloyl-ACP methyl ester carboxylesterase